MLDVEPEELTPQFAWGELCKKNLSTYLSLFAKRYHRDSVLPDFKIKLDMSEVSKAHATSSPTELHAFAVSQSPWPMRTDEAGNAWNHTSLGMGVLSEDGTDFLDFSAKSSRLPIRFVQEHLAMDLSRMDKKQVALVRHILKNQSVNSPFAKAVKAKKLDQGILEKGAMELLLNFLSADGVFEHAYTAIAREMPGLLGRKGEELVLLRAEGICKFGKVLQKSEYIFVNSKHLDRVRFAH